MCLTSDRVVTIDVLLLYVATLMIEVDTNGAVPDGAGTQAGVHKTFT